MEHKPLRVKAVERLLGQLRQEGRLVVKPVVTHPPKLPYKRHNPNESGLKRYELKGGRYLIRSEVPRRNRKCKNLDCERKRQARVGGDEYHEEAFDTCDDESVASNTDATGTETIFAASETNTASSTTVIATKTALVNLATDSGARSATNIETCPDLVATTSSPSLSSSQNHFYHHYHHNHHHHHVHHPMSQHNEDDGQALYFQMDHSMFYLSSLEDGFLTEETHPVPSMR